MNYIQYAYSCKDRRLSPTNRCRKDAWSILFWVFGPLYFPLTKWLTNGTHLSNLQSINLLSVLAIQGKGMGCLAGSSRSVATLFRGEVEDSSQSKPSSGAYQLATLLWSRSKLDPLDFGFSKRGGGKTQSHPPFIIPFFSLIELL